MIVICSTLQKSKKVSANFALLTYYSGIRLSMFSKTLFFVMSTRVECWCGNSLKYPLISAFWCNSVASGSNDIAGGPWALSVYSASISFSNTACTKSSNPVCCQLQTNNPCLFIWKNVKNKHNAGLTEARVMLFFWDTWNLTGHMRKER